VLPGQYRRIGTGVLSWEDCSPSIGGLHPCHMAVMGENVPKKFINT
jgi:hypothetical protein